MIYSQRELWECWTYLRAELMPALTDDPGPVREAKLFAHVLRHAPITIPQDCIYAGDFGTDEYEPEIDTNRMKAEPARPDYGDGLWKLIEEHTGSFPGSGGYAHTTLDYPRLLKDGLRGVLDEIDEDRSDYLRAMAIALRAVIDWSRRFAGRAERMAAAEPDSGRKDELLAIAERCARVPEHPARTLPEALQSLRLASIAIGISEGSFASISLGRLDQYLHPLHQRDDRDVEKHLSAFFRSLNRTFDPAINVNIGGLDADGRDGFNPLSASILRVVKELKLPAPILAVRIHEHTPDEQFAQFINPELFSIGQPTFYGEEAARAALCRRGIPDEQLHAWGPNSCMGIMMLGQEWSDMWGSVLNAIYPLELALNQGSTISGAALGLDVEAMAEYESFDQIFAKCCEYQDAFVRVLAAETKRRADRRGQEQPNPYVSALLSDCVQRGRDRLDGGCRYTTIIFETIGLVNAADALCSIRELVFERGRFTLAEMIEALRDDFASRPDILTAIRRLPKFGNGDPDTDRMAAELAASFAESVMQQSDATYTFCPSFHTLHTHVNHGARTGASLDGRLAGEALAKNIGTSPGRAINGHTALIRSATAIDQSLFFGGQALDLYVDPGLFKRSSDRQKIRDLIRTYHRLGGLEVQVNTVDPQTLHAAQESPEQHGDVLVRKAGFTARFVHLGGAEQDDIIERFEHGV